MSYVLGIDLGTTYTAAAVHDEGGTRIVSLSHDRVAIPSVVAPVDGRSLVGDETAVISATAPWNVAREFKRRFGDSTPMYIDGQAYAPEDLMGDLLQWVVRRVTEQEGRGADRIVVTHPATWGLYKLDLLRSAASARSIDIDTIAEPVAAAIHYEGGNRFEIGSTIAVYDFGGGTFDVTLLERSDDSFAFKGAGGVERAGGLDLDAAVFRLVVDAIGDQFDELDDQDPVAQRAVLRLREECTRAKIGLSYDTRAIVPVVLPGLVSEVLVQRKEFEDLVEPLISETVAATMELLERAGQGTQLDAVLLVGGSSRVPIVSQLLTRALGVPVAVDTHPKQAVALGAAASADPARRAGLVAARPSFFAKAAASAERQELPESTITIPVDATTSVQRRQRFVVVLTGRNGGRVVDLPAGPTIVGRQEAEGVIGLESPLVSRQHLEFFRDGTKISVRDLGSTNGTSIDGLRVGPTPISIEPGTIVDVAGTLLMVDGPGAQVESPSAIVDSWNMPELVTSGLRRRRNQTDEWMRQLEVRRPALELLTTRLRRARRFGHPGSAVLRLWQEQLPRRLADITVPPGSVVLGWCTLPSLLNVELPGSLSRGDRERAQRAIGHCVEDATVPLVVSLLGHTTVVSERSPESSALARSIVAELQLSSPLVAVSVTSDAHGEVAEIVLDIGPSGGSMPSAIKGRVVFGPDQGSSTHAQALISLTGDLAEYQTADMQVAFTPAALAT